MNTKKVYGGYHKQTWDSMIHKYRGMDIAKVRKFYSYKFESYKLL